MQIDPSGKFVYGSNRGHDSIAVFAVDPKSGKLTLVEHQSTRGKTPRHFAIDPTGKWLLAENQDSDTIAVLRIDPKTGGLSTTGQLVSVPAPVRQRHPRPGQRGQPPAGDRAGHLLRRAGLGVPLAAGQPRPRRHSQLR